VLYAGYRYGWDARDVGFVLAGVGVCSAIVQGAVVGPAVRRLGERRVLLVGSPAGHRVLRVRTGTHRLLSSLPCPSSRCGAGVAGGAGLMTRHIGPTEQGALQARPVA